MQAVLLVKRPILPPEAKHGDPVPPLPPFLPLSALQRHGSGEQRPLLDEEELKNLSVSRGTLTDEALQEHTEALAKIPGQIQTVLDDDDLIQRMARDYRYASNFLYLGRGVNFPVALEGALKLKEISYIHAEGYPAGEMKHGPIALVEESVPSVFLNPRDSHYDKVRSNLREVQARGGPVLGLITEGDTAAATGIDIAIDLPDCHPHVLPMVAAVPMQLLAYHMADFKGTDVDQPRNLAKSVTVE